MVIRIEKETKINNEADYLNLRERSLRKYWSNEKTIEAFIRSALWYKKVGHFHEGLAWFRLNGKYGYVNKEGKEVVKAKYDEVGDFINNMRFT